LERLLKFIQLQTRCPGVHKVRVGPATWTAVCSWLIANKFHSTHYTLHSQLPIGGCRVLKQPGHGVS